MYYKALGIVFSLMPKYFNKEMFRFNDDDTKVCITSKYMPKHTDTDKNIVL